MEKTNLEFNKLIYVGFSILDISKYLIYEFHYDVLLKKYRGATDSVYRNKIRLCYQDTDSSIYEIETEDMGEMKEWFGFSDYPKDHLLYDESNKKVIEKFKDTTKKNTYNISLF